MMLVWVHGVHRNARSNGFRLSCVVRIWTSIFNSYFFTWFLVVDWGDVTFLSAIIETPHTRRMLPPVYTKVPRSNLYPFNCLFEVICPVFVPCGWLCGEIP